MGIGNTAASSMWMTCLTGIPLVDCVGAGSGLDNEGVKHKYNILRKALENYKGDNSTLDVIRYFGGYEMVMAVGGMLRAAELKMVILVDGFIMTNCVLAASHLYPEMLPYCIFGHCGDESGHKLVLDALHARPLLNLGLRLGEGTGAICAYPIVDSAVRMLNEMDNFADKYLYHVTDRATAAKILKNGLCPMIGQRSRLAGEEDERIYLTEKSSLPYY